MFLTGKSVKMISVGCENDLRWSLASCSLWCTLTCAFQCCRCCWPQPRRRKRFGAAQRWCLSEPLCKVGKEKEIKQYVYITLTTKTCIWHASDLLLSAYWSIYKHTTIIWFYFLHRVIFFAALGLFLNAITCTLKSSPYATLSRGETHLVLRVHLGHHAILQKVKGQHLQHIKLVGHLVINGLGAPDYILKDRQEEITDIK